MKQVDQVFVSHWPPLADRRRYLERSLADFGIDAEWVTQFDKRTLSGVVISRYYRFDPGSYVKRAALTPSYSRSLPPHRLSAAEIANGITHLFIYSEILRRNLNLALIIEDDVIPCVDFRARLDAYLDQLPPTWDLCFVGSGINLHVPATQPGHFVYRHPQGATRTLDCYLITQSAARKILSSVVPFVLPLDVELNYHSDLHSLEVYWSEPPLAVQGSELGFYPSTVLSLLGDQTA